MERVEKTEGRTFAHHIKRYEFAAGLIESQDVCSLACGTGYGEHHMMIHGKPRRIVGIDISQEAVDYAKKYYPHPQIVFEQSNNLSSAHPAGSFDTFVSFETIEHLVDDRGFLSEIKRVLKPGGTLILSTPNRGLSWRNLFAKKPLNPFHVREYKKEELDSLLREFFKDIKFYGQKRILRRSFSNILIYAWYKLRGQLGRFEPENFEVVEYPTDPRYSTAYFLVVCKAK